MAKHGGVGRPSMNTGSTPPIGRTMMPKVHIDENGKWSSAEDEGQTIEFHVWQNMDDVSALSVKSPQEFITCPNKDIEELGLNGAMRKAIKEKYGCEVNEKFVDALLILVLDLL